MNTSCFLNSLCTTRFLIVVLAFFGYRGLDTTECVTVQECSAPEVVNVSQSVPPLQNLHSNDVLYDTSEDAPSESDRAVRECVETLQERGRVAIQNLMEADINADVDMPASSQPGDFSDANLLNFMHHILDAMLRDGHPFLSLVHQYLRNKLDNSALQADDGSAPSTTANEEPDNDSTELIIETDTHADTTSDELELSSDDDESEDGTTSTGWMDTLRNAYNSAKEYIVGNDKDPEKPVPSLYQRIKTIGANAAKATANKVASAIVSLSDKTGFTKTINSKLRGFVFDVFGLDPNIEGVNDPMPAIIPDESCFLEKLSRLNAFYLKNTDLYPQKIAGYTLYGVLPESVDVAHATPPFETVKCSSTSQFVVASNGLYTPSYISTIIIALLIS